MSLEELKELNNTTGRNPFVSQVNFFKDITMKAMDRKKRGSQSLRKSGQFLRANKQTSNNTNRETSSQSLRKSGQFLLKNYLQPFCNNLRKSRNPFVSQVNFFGKVLMPLAGKPVLWSQSLRKSGQFLLRRRPYRRRSIWIKCRNPFVSQVNFFPKFKAPDKNCPTVAIPS